MAVFENTEITAMLTVANTNQSTKPNVNGPKVGKLAVLDLFSGIGGFSLGLECTGRFETVAFCEAATFPRKVLRKNWPGVNIYRDVRELTDQRLVDDGIRKIDVLVGGFPCQDLSTAGKGAGLAGSRSGLWAEQARLIGKLHPSYAVIENVAVLRSRGLDRVLRDLTGLGYNAEWHTISASAVGAPHRRDRLWIIAYPQPVVAPLLTTADLAAAANNHWDSPPPPRIAPKVPNGAVRLRALGNSIVPQIATAIGRAIARHHQASMLTKEAA